MLTRNYGLLQMAIKREGKEEDYTSKFYSDSVRYKIGRADKKIDRLIQKYEINYTLYNEVFEKDGVYQVYFNAIGTSWKIRIKKANITVKFENGEVIEKKEIEKLEVYTGSLGKKGQNYEILQNDGEIKITTKEELPSQNGLSFMLNLRTSKINLSDPSNFETTFLSIKNLGPILTVILLIYTVVTGYLFSRNPKKRAIVPEFNTKNKEYSAMFLGYFDHITGKLRKVKNEGKIFSIGIVSLISKGFIEVKEDTYKLNLSKDTSELFPEELAVFNALSTESEDIFSDEKKIYGTMLKVTEYFDKKIGFSEKKKGIGKLYNDNFGIKYWGIFICTVMYVFTVINPHEINRTGFKELVMIILVSLMIASIVTVALVDKGYIRANMNHLGVKLVGYASVFVWWLYNMEEYGKYAVYLIIGSIICLIYVKLPGRFNPEGQRLKEYISGLKMYIMTAEQNQIKKMDTVEELITFSKEIFPFAVAFDIKSTIIEMLEKEAGRNNFNEKEREKLRNLGGRISNYGYMETRTIHTYNKISSKYSSSGHAGGGSGGGGGGIW